MHSASLVLLALVGVTLSFAVPAVKSPKGLKDQELVDYINKQGKWKAAVHPRFAGKSHEEIRKFLGARKLSERPAHLRPKPSKPYPSNGDIPASFDARTNWPQCTDVISKIHDQANCGSCWAVSAAAAMSDRLCIASNGTNKTPISASDITSCCSDCGDGCSGGWPYEAFYWYSHHGVVSGSDYAEDSGCRPYPLPPCEHHTTKTTYKPCGDVVDTPACTKTCQATYKTRTYKQDKYYGNQLVYYSGDVESIQRDLMANGPLVVAFDVYEDFLTYQSGVYQNLGGEPVGGHAIRVVGWGTDENGVDYWICLNQWNEDWGDSGSIKFIRGTDNCGIEDEVTGAQADLSRLPN